jgi:carbon monoxide dehydrogenase subunit G
VDLSNSFEVARPIDETWALLTDLERVAPCLPGAHLQEVEGGEYRGVVKVRIGRINAQYEGAATFLEQNDTDYKIVLMGQGLDTREAGNAEATITAKLEPVSDTTTRVNIDTDLTLSGRVAQLGKSVIPDVSTTLIGQFADNLAAMLDSDPAVGRASVEDGHYSARRLIDMPEPEAIDLMDAARTPVLKRLLAVVVVVLLVRWLLRRQR